MLKIYSIIILLTFSLRILAQDTQVEIKGIVSDTSGIVLKGVSVSIVKESGAGLYFISTGEDGRFHFNIPDSVINAIPLFIKCSSVEYEIYEAALKLPLVSKLNIVLQKKIIELEPVTVVNKKKGVQLSSDTTSYKVSDIKTSDDRVIADVIKKIPGIEVDKNGTISYNGKIISSVYIDGDNVLGGRYNMATNNLPPGIVDEVQVIEREQPIKALNGYVISNNTALNLSLLNTGKIISANTAGITASNKGFGVSLFSALLKKNTKLLSELKANNLGTNLEDVAETERIASGGKEPLLLSSDFLSDRVVVNIPANDVYWLKNKDASLNLNLFKKNKQDFSIRFNLLLFHVQKKISQFFNTTYNVVPTPQVYIDSMSDIQKRNVASPMLNFEWNRRKFFLNTLFKAELPMCRSNGEFSNNDFSFDQSLKQNNYFFSNNTNLIKAVKTNMVFQYSSNIDYNSARELLYNTPGIHADLINNGQKFAVLQQVVNPEGLQVQQQAFLRQKYYKLAVTLGVGGLYIKDKLTSQLYYGDSAKSIVPVPGDYANNNKLETKKIYGSAEMIFSVKNSYVKVSLSPAYYTLMLKDFNTITSWQKQQFIWQPDLSFRIAAGRYSEYFGGYSQNISLSKMNDLFRSGIAVDYLNLFSNAIPPFQTENNQYSLFYKYSQPIKLLFYSLRVSALETKADFISSYVFDKGTIRVISIPYKNAVKTYSVTALFSKYLFFLKTNLNLSVAAGNTKGVNLMNDKAMRYTLHNIKTSAGFKSKLSKNLFWEAKIDNAWLINKPDKSFSESGLHKSYTMNLSSNLQYSFNESLSIRPEYKWIKIKGNATGEGYAIGFFDFMVRWKMSKSNSELSLTGNNILGKDVYMNYAVSPQSVFINKVPLVTNRVLLTYLFNF